MPLSPLRLLATVVLLSSLTPHAQALTRTVELDGSGDFMVIQEALEASADGDTVLVGPGVYSWTNQGSGDEHGLVRYWLNEQDGVRLIGREGPKQTVLDAEGQGRVFFANGSNFDRSDVYLRGFTLRNGYAPKVANREEQEGGAIAFHLTYGVVVDCIFENNEAEHGGAVWCGGEGAYRFTNCRFVNNRAIKIKDTIDPVGGAMIFFGPELDPEQSVIDGCTFIGNSSDRLAGGIFAGQSNLVIKDSLFSANSSPPLSDTLGRRGTGIYSSNSAFLRLEGVTVRDHTSSPGEAVRVAATDALEVERCNFSHPASGLNFQVSDVASLSVSCTNIHGGFPGNWLGALTGFRTINDNLQVDAMFCGDGGDLRRVETGSPMLAANNACATDIGRVVGDCFAVPVLAANLTAHRIGEGAVLRWEGTDPRQAGLRLERVAAGRAASLDPGLAAVSPGGWRLEDPDAPLAGVEYVLRDRDRRELARANLPALGEVRLLRPSPNPFNPRTTIAFELARSTPVRLEVFDARGRRIATLVDATRGPGLHEEVFEGRDRDGHALASGVYHLRLEADGQLLRRSMVLVR